MNLHEARETLQLEMSDTSTLHDLHQLINSSDDLIHNSLDPSASVEAHQSLAPSGESATIESEKSQAIVHDSMCTGSTGETSGMDGPDPMDAGSRRLSEPFLLKKILLEKSGDTSEFTTLVISVHAVMLESGFILFNTVSSSDKFSFSKELLSVSLRYTLPKLVESVTVTFLSLSDKVVVYGSLSGYVRRVYLDKDRFVPFINSLKSDKEVSSSIYHEVFMFWRLVKDGLVTPLLIDLCDKSGLESPPCFMSLPTELKLKIVESLPGASVAKMACVCREIGRMASDDALWKQKIWEEARHLLLLNGAKGSVNWKAKFACFWIHYQQKLSTGGQHKRQTLPNIGMGRNHRNRFPRIISDTDPFGMFNGDHLHGSVGIHRGLQRLAGRRFSTRCSLGVGN